MNDTLTVVAATHGGFLVLQDRPDDGIRNEPLFAGDLDAVLQFIRKRFTAVEAAPA